MTQADSVHSTPPTNTSVTRRSALGTIAAATAALAATGASPTAAAPGLTESALLDPAFALIAEKRAADIAHCEAIDAQDEAERDDGINSDAAEEASQRCGVACGVANTDAIGPEGWHYQLRATMATAAEALIEQRAGKAVQS
jgi:hypothetical protein